MFPCPAVFAWKAEWNRMRNVCSELSASDSHSMAGGNRFQRNMRRMKLCSSLMAQLVIFA